MKRNFFFLCILFAFILSATAQDSSRVFFTSEISPESVLRIFSHIDSTVTGKVAVKVHFGEEGNTNFLSPELSRLLIESLNGTYVETNVLYVGKRRYTESHKQLARDHGFVYAPVDILDDEGYINIPVDLNHYKMVRGAKGLDRYDTYVIFSHFKGHGSAGFGGAIKNVSMGLAAISGKMAMHASSIPIVRNASKCIRCDLCVEKCPVDAITLDPVVIDSLKCIGCGMCIGECPERIFNIPWRSTERSVFQERLVEYAKGISDGRNMLYINVLANIARECDCAGRSTRPFMEDIGILASTDMLAIEAASHDLVNKGHKCQDAFLKETGVSGQTQLDYARKIGLGNPGYILIDINRFTDSESGEDEQQGGDQ